MRFADDTRARIPFAFLGALLVLSSTIYAAGAAPNQVVEPVSDEVVDDAQIGARMALTTAVRSAGRQAAKRPVLEPGSAGMAPVLSSQDTFRSYVRLLIALEARQTLDSAHARTGSLSANVTLPPMRTRSAVESAMDAVELVPVGDHRYRVSFRDLRVTLNRHGRPVDRHTYNTSVTLRIPALRLHDRTTRFESRLNQGLLHPGFTRDLTTRLFAITWVRGYAQYGGAPISNVLANRHVEVMANDALLSQQAAVFGAEDRDGRRLTRRAVTNVALRDAFLGAEDGLKSALTSPRGESTGGDTTPRAPSVPLPSVYDAESTYDIDHTADQAFLQFVDGASDPDLDSVVDTVYRADVRARTSARFRDTQTSHRGMVPPNGTLIWTGHETDRSLAGGSWSTPEGGSQLREYDGRVVVTETTRRFYASNYTLGVTTDTRRSTYEVSISLQCRYASPGPAPARPISRCPFGAVARDRLTDAAMDEVLRDAGGVDDLAIGAVKGDSGTGWDSVDIAPPAAATRAAYDGTADLRKRTTDISVDLETRSIASSANPASVLADTLGAERDRLLDTPHRYHSARDRAVTAARGVYLDQLRDRLRSRSPMVDRAQQALAKRLQKHAIPAAPPESQDRSLSTVASGIESDPAYLSLAASGSAPSMVARNVNVFAVPYGDAADAVSEHVGGSQQSVSLRTAAQTLSVVESGSEHSGAESALRRSIAASLERAERRYIEVLAPVVGHSDARGAVRDASGRWNSVSERALALTDGRLVAAIVSEVAGETSHRETDRLAVELRVASTSLREDATVRVEESLVESVAADTTAGSSDAATARSAGASAGSAAVSAGMEEAGSRLATAGWKRATDSKATALPAGLPLLPVPGAWYATVNAWTVSVRGSYDRFTVRAQRASPGRANGTLQYVRTAETVSVDVDGDGTAETLGRNRPITFSADTGVLIVVPPGGSGVGDVDGNADERSPGWGTDPVGTAP